MFQSVGNQNDSDDRRYIYNITKKSVRCSVLCATLLDPQILTKVADNLLFYPLLYLKVVTVRKRKKLCSDTAW